MIVTFEDCMKMRWYEKKILSTRTVSAEASEN